MQARRFIGLAALVAAGLALAGCGGSGRQGRRRGHREATRAHAGESERRRAARPAAPLGRRGAQALGRDAWRSSFGTPGASARPRTRPGHSRTCAPARSTWAGSAPAPSTRSGSRASRLSSRRSSSTATTSRPGSSRRASPSGCSQGVDEIDLVGIGVLPGPMRKVLGVSDAVRPPRRLRRRRRRPPGLRRRGDDAARAGRDPARRPVVVAPRRPRRLRAAALGDREQRVRPKGGLRDGQRQPLAPPARDRHGEEELRVAHGRATSGAAGRSRCGDARVARRLPRRGRRGGVHALPSRADVRRRLGERRGGAPDGAPAGVCEPGRRPGDRVGDERDHPAQAAARSPRGGARVRGEGSRRSGISHPRRSIRGDADTAGLGRRRASGGCGGRNGDVHDGRGGRRT